MTAALVTTVLDEVTWRARRVAHEERVDVLLADHRDRRSRQIEHPVEDFLFEY